MAIKKKEQSLGENEVYKVVWNSGPGKHLQIGSHKFENGEPHYLDSFPVPEGQFRAIPGMVVEKVDKSEVVVSDAKVTEAGHRTGSGVLWKNTPIRTIVVNEKIHHLRKDIPYYAFTEDQIQYVCKTYLGVERV